MLPISKKGQKGENLIFYLSFYGEENIKSTLMRLKNGEVMKATQVISGSPVLKSSENMYSV